MVCAGPVAIPPLSGWLLAGLAQKPQTGGIDRSTPMSSATAQRLTAILHREEEVYVAECPEVGTVSQGDTVEEALANLRRPPNCSWRSVRSRRWRQGCSPPLR